MDIAIHTNYTFKHQCEYAERFRRGFKRHGLNAVITPNPRQPADCHVVLGPHYAKRFWINHPHVILLDRSFYKPDPVYVSVGWMNSHGARDFVAGTGRPLPVVRECPKVNRSIFLADYNGVTEQADTVRLHPANRRYSESLAMALERHNVAIGYTTSALVAAALRGLRVICKDEHHILNNANWRGLLAFADWHYTEIESGELWVHLLQQKSLFNRWKSLSR